MASLDSQILDTRPEGFLRASSRLQILGLMGAMAVMPFFWITFAALGGRSLKPLHLMIAFLAGLLVVQGINPALRRPRFINVAGFTLSYGLFMSGLMLSLFWAGLRDADLGVLAKNGVYFVGFLVLYLVLRNRELRSQDVALAIYLGCVVGLICFCLNFLYVHWRLGRNLPAELIAAVASGDLMKLRFGFYPEVFNYSLPDDVPEKLKSLRVTIKNSMIGTFVVWFSLLLAYRKVAEQILARWFCRTALAVLGLFIWFVVLTSMSRLNILAIGATVTLGLVLQFAVAKEREASRLLLATALLLLVISCLALFFFEQAGNFSAAVQERFEGTTTGGRVAHATATLQRISDRPLTGYGVGATVRARGEPFEMVPHNLFLAAWYHGGLPTFLASCLVGYCLVAAWATAALRFVRDPDSWRLAISPFWILTLPTLPFLFSLIHGYWTLVEFIALAFFYAALANNEETVGW